ncbi:MAG: hypothetical protein MUD09_00420 [Desulfobacterales bacterium]|nr:hypothetical protein [Desulfobacterales bacterium]
MNEFQEADYETNPKIVVYPNSISVQTTYGGSSKTGTLQITNNGGGTLTWSLSDTKNWLTYSPTSGSATNGEVDSITVTFNPSGLAHGCWCKREM